MIYPIQIRAARSFLELSQEDLARLADLGIVGIGMPEADGGAGLGFAEVAIVLEEVGRTVAQVPALPVMGMAAPFLAEHSPKHLAGLASGEEINDRDEDEDDEDVEDDQVVFIVEGGQLGYGSKRAWEVAY